MEVEIAWAAGLFEGEGTIVTTGRGIQLAVEMTDRDVVIRFHRVVGFGSVQYVRAKNGRKEKWKWFGFGRRAVYLLHALAPQLGSRRSARAWAAIAHYRQYCAVRVIRPDGSYMPRGIVHKNHRGWRNVDRSQVA